MKLTQFNYSVLLILFICSVAEIRSSINVIVNEKFGNYKFINNLKPEEETKTEQTQNNVQNLPKESNSILKKFCNII
jgi:hypothetical protein